MSNTAETWNLDHHRARGDSISWFSWENRSLMGFTKKAPNPGDRVISEMESGKFGEFKIISVDRKTDPKDMWFAKVEDAGYLP